MPCEREMELRAHPSEASRARSWTRDRFDAWGLGDLSETAQLLVSELVTNALLYGGKGGPTRLRVGVQGTLRLEVTDSSTEPPTPRHAGPDDIGGRGLELVDVLADRWGWNPREDGKTV